MLCFGTLPGRAHATAGPALAAAASPALAGVELQTNCHASQIAGSNAALNVKHGQTQAVCRAVAGPFTHLTAAQSAGD